MKSYHVTLISLFILAFVANANAQCNCTFTISPSGGQVTFDGAARGVQPGNTICLATGGINNIVFRNIIGTKSNPVVITNCNGVASVSGQFAQNAVSFLNSKFVRFTGSGDPSSQYGIHLGGSNVGFLYSGLSSDVEIDHVEIASVPFAGIMIKTDPSSNCLDVSATRPNFTLRNVSVHDNYIHDTGIEGIYIGSPFYSGTQTFCGEMQYPHEVRGLKIYNNRIENTGWEGIQVGSAVEDVEIFKNTLLGCGSTDQPNQNYSVLLGQGTTGKFYQNSIVSAHGATLTVSGIGNQLIYNNVFVSEAAGSNIPMLITLRPTPLATDIVPTGFLGGVYIINNTFINRNATEVIKEALNAAPGNQLLNNLVVTPTSPWDQMLGTSQWTKTNNLVTSDISTPRFVNGPGGNYQLTPASPAIYAGVDVSKWGITADFAGKPITGRGVCIGAFQVAGPSAPTNVKVK